MNTIEASCIIGVDEYNNLIKDNNSIDIIELMKTVSKSKTSFLHTGIKSHNIFDTDKSKNDFIIIIRNGEIFNKKEIEDLNQYIKNSNRSYFFEGIKRINDSNHFYIIWGS